MDYIALWPAFGITPAVRKKLMRISPAAIDRILRKDKAALALKGKSLTKSVGLLKHRIPNILTLTAADAASGWICLYSLLDKAHRWTFAALKDVYAGLPFPLREFHSDNSSEFINQVVTAWLRNPACPTPFTRSGTTRKMTTACGPLVRVEQKNGAVVREYIGYDRLEGNDLQARLTAVYRRLAPPP
ncbi:MAG: hypothetical protein LBH70_00565 [Spirochaetaceae bacterium]|jgi:hypothetical protein|nr:hypothetical protein [Spirochaetaceae bacterium]